MAVVVNATFKAVSMFPSTTARAAVMVRVTADARDALGLVVGQPVWVLVKAVSLRGRVFSGPDPRSQP